ncbi:hypothetical protein [Novosphingobium sp. UBA6272]|uniref:hypothetical protein n=1 Tax=Novosphingobium sp. UBA6272 TaxID=1946984 RepID=UPI0025DBA2FC|nr:hypothetical protein [Novosphingobium sp. UBA6272]HQV04677.1 hypothetical protein [Novosphingobium sp.]
MNFQNLFIWAIGKCKLRRCTPRLETASIELESGCAALALGIFRSMVDDLSMPIHALQQSNGRMEL